MLILCLQLLIGVLSPRTITDAPTYLRDPSTICPPADIIAPCICFKTCDVCPAHIQCSNITSIDQLLDVFDASTDWSFWNLIIERSIFMFIPAESITEKRIRKLILRDDVLSSLFDVTPPPSNLLDELELTNVTVHSGIRWEVFASLSRLKELNISDFDIRVIDKAFINNFPPGLTGLYFTNTKTRSLGANVFTKLTNLTRINIRSSPLQTLKRSMFPENSNLIAMNFSHTEIETVPEDLFDDMPDLATLDFSSTKLSSLDEEVFGRVMPQLKLLWLEGNPINCGCKMKWITKLKNFPFHLKVRCTKPKALEGLEITELKPKDFAHCDQ